MSKLNVFAIFGMLFLSSVLLGSGMYSSSANQVYAQENQTGTENEAEIKADIEQENKCENDTGCENENELNNQLSTVNKTQTAAESSLTVKKEIFGCDNIIYAGAIMSCDLEKDNPAWLPCTNSAISNLNFCQGLSPNEFDMQVLDDQNSPIQDFEGSTAGTTIQNLQPGTYTVNEIKHQSNFQQLGIDDLDQTRCMNDGFADGGDFFDVPTDITYVTLCFEYEDEQGNDCSTVTLAAGEEKTCIVKNYIQNAAVH